MAKTSKTVTTLKCDCCGKTVTDFAKNIDVTRGFRPIEPYGVSISFSGFGDYVKDVCEECAKKALLEAAENIRRKAINLSE